MRLPIEPDRVELEATHQVVLPETGHGPRRRHARHSTSADGATRGTASTTRSSTVSFSCIRPSESTMKGLSL